MRSSSNRGNRAWTAGCLALALFGAAGACGRFGNDRSGGKKVIVLGMDGLDPTLLRRYIAEGKLPHFAKLAEHGDFRELGTSNPPQSPVAWSNLITGMNPGGHGIFDFIHRDPRTMTPYLSTSRVEPPKHTLKVGSWVLPLSGGTVSQLRSGKAFWEVLEEHDIPATVFRMPSNFPPVGKRSRTFAGMGTPDLLGTYGTFSYFTDDLFAPAGAVNGGHVYAVRVENSRVKAQLTGPYNSFRKGAPAVTADFTVWLDPVEPVAKIALQGQEIILKEGEWSGWMRVQFDLLPFLSSVRGICRFYLKQAHPGFQLYATPINLDPADPALPLSTPAEYSRELAEELGPFYTQGIAEDTKAVTAGVLNDAEFLQQSREVMSEQLRIFDRELRRFQAGLFFFYFSSTDQNAHMFWRAMDERHPGYSAEVAAKFSGVLEDIYVRMDEALGKAMERLDQSTTLLVVSDHGFAPYYQSFNLNTWLLQNGYLALKPGAAVSGGRDYLADVDWSRTRAYGLGLNALYLNLRGRERDGIVAPGAEAEGLLAEITGKLLAVRNDKLHVLSRVDRASAAYSGARVGEAPDLILGYNRGYRAGWGTVLGGFNKSVLEDNIEAWSGDHCMDFTQVPGVILSNKKLALADPALTDIAPTLLEEFGIRKEAPMTGRAVFAQASGGSR